MGREVRKVKSDWLHPKKGDSFIPLFGGSFLKQLKEWDISSAKWEEGFQHHWEEGWVAKDDDMDYPYSEWAGKRPVESDYMPDWPEEERTHFMMYEDTTEGTPISSAFETPEELARWLADNGASAFGSSTATYEQWLATIKRGWAPSMIASSEGLQSGVEALD